MVKQFSIALFALLTFSGYTQNQTKAQEVLDQLKQDPRFEDGGADWVQFSELLLNYAKEPISLNKATLEEKNFSLVQLVVFLTQGRQLEVNNSVTFQRFTSREK